MIIVYTGDGKGKTTAALGLALRNLGHGKKVISIHFMKNFQSGEIKFEHPNYEKYQFGTGNFIIKPTEKDKKLAREALNLAKEKIKDADLLILDELNVALYFNLISSKEVIEFLKDIPKEKNVVITGRKAPKELIEIANLVTEMKEIKHPYKKGLPAKEGIEW